MLHEKITGTLRSLHSRRSSERAGGGSGGEGVSEGVPHAEGGTRTP